MHEPNIVLLGGGTGSFTLLPGLKKLTSNITAIVTMSDDGGSTGVLRDELGVLPPGDARQCLVALSDAPEIRELFGYRFGCGTMAGHTVGNLILSALEMQYGSFPKALEVASGILNITGRVMPVTLDKHTLIVQDGETTYRGEHVIDGAVPISRAATVTLKPTAVLNSDARAAIETADLIVIAPGSVYTSLLPIFAVGGMREALTVTSATIACVANLINKPLQTDDWHVVDYVRQYERYIGEGTIDTVLYNDKRITPYLLKRYAAEGEFPVATDTTRFETMRATAIPAQLVAKSIVDTGQSGDAVRRTLIRHDTDRVCAELAKLLTFQN